MFYGGNDWRDYLAHSWGTSPEMKAKEREYNAKYYQEHKDEILARRKKDGYGGWEYDKDFDENNAGFEGGRYTDRRKEHDLVDHDDIRSKLSGMEFDTEIEEQNEYTTRSEWFKGLPPEVQKNVKAHNDGVTQNIQLIQAKVDDYLQSHPDLPDDKKNQLLKNLKSQIVKAEDEYITPNSSEDRKYVEDLMKKAQRG